MLRYNIETYELREIPDAQIAMWEETNNPKLAYYPPAPPKPAENAVWGAGTWVIPPVVIPESISARQIRLWLIMHGISLAAVEQAIDQIPDEQQRDITRVEWEYAPYVERTHPMLIPLATVLGLSSEIIDQAFIEASQL